MSGNVPGQDMARHEVPEGPSLGTVVWGAVVVVLSALLLVADVGWFRLDPRAAAITLLVLVGAGLVVGGAVASMRRRNPR